jgi:hypothetical protein
LHNSGIVYAKAVPDDRGVLHPYSLSDPWLTRLPDGQWAIVARRIECDGTPDAASADHVLFFTSPDLIHYTEQPLLHESDPLAQAYFVRKAPELGGIELPEGCVPHSVIDIPEEVAARLFELGFEAFEQGKGIGRSAGETGHHLAAVQPAHLAGRMLHHHALAHGHLTVAAYGHAMLIAHGKNSRSPKFHDISCPTGRSSLF